MILKNCIYLDYDSHWEAISEKCHVRMNYVYTRNCLFIFSNIELVFFFHLSLTNDTCLKMYLFWNLPFSWRGHSV